MANSEDRGDLGSLGPCWDRVGLDNRKSNSEPDGGVFEVPHICRQQREDVDVRQWGVASIDEVGLDRKVVQWGMAAAAFFAVAVSTRASFRDGLATFAVGCGLVCFLLMVRHFVPDSCSE
jgi:hypothetical protein